MNPGSERGVFTVEHVSAELNLLEKIISEVRNGKSITEISKELNVSFSFVKKKCQELNLSPAKGKQGGRNKIDMKGIIFGSLTVIEEGNKHPKKSIAMWKCKCICGNICERNGSDLRLGKTKTCGCRKGITSKRNWQGYKNVSKSKWRVIGQNALQRNLEFSITIEFISNLFDKQNKKCALSGMELDSKNMSLDRINSNLGYTKNNVQWLHKKINKLKGKYSDNELIELCRKVSEHNDSPKFNR